MNINSDSQQVYPPRLIPTFVKGFNIVANQVYLILIPFFLDLALWLGPKLRIKELLLPSITSVTDSMLKFGSPDLADTIKSSLSLWQQFLDQFNLLTVIRTLPIGVPSLMVRDSSMASPLSSNWIIEISSIKIAVSIFGGLLILGFFLGAIYFELISRASTKDAGAFNWKGFFEKYAQTILFFLTLVAVIVLLAFPILVLTSVLSLVSPGIGQLIIWVMLFLAIWIVMPLIFTVHGIFALKQKVIPSMLLSMRMVRFFLPGTGLFILTAVIINEGMNMLWVLPDPKSWFLAVGLFGHAFIVTALLAGTFIFYREGLNWMQYMIQKINRVKQEQENGGSTIDQQ